MKQIAVLFILCLSFFASAKGSRVKPLVCPIDVVHKEDRKVAIQEFKLKKKARMLICVPPEMTEDGKLKSKFLTRYDAYLFDGKKPGKRVLSGSINKPVLFEQKKGEIYEVMHLSLKGIYHPLFQEKIVCDKGVCKRAEKKCVFNQYHLSPPGPKEIEREKVIYAKGAAQVQEMTEGDLALMAELALSGRKLANDFFLTMDPPILMGVTRPFYQHMQDLLKQIKSEGCLKVAAK
jgi:hypothetical protein